MKGRIESIGFAVAVLGVAVVLLWIGIFKFTPTEAKAIEPLVSNSPLMSWMYRVMSVEQASYLIGSVEIFTAICLLLHFLWRILGIIGGGLAILTFITTLSFLFTTPEALKTVDGVPIAEFFILKDIMALGIALMVFGRSLQAPQR